MNGTFRVLLVLAAALSLAVAVYHLSRRAAARRNDLMSLADSLEACGAVALAAMPGHRHHDCKHTAGHLDYMHLCGYCGTYYVTPAYVSNEINALKAMLHDPVEPDRRTR